MPIKFTLRFIFALLLLTLPFWNGYRIDLDQSKVYLFGFQLGHYASYLFVLFTMAVIIGFLALAVLWSRVFCKWVCPHNWFSMFMYKVESKLGKGGAFVVSVIGSLLMAYSTVSFFYNPLTVLDSLLTFKMNKYFWLVIGVTAVYTVMTHEIRHRFCKVCPYGVAQSISVIKWRKFSDLIKNPAVWISWGTTSALVVWLVIGWMS